MSFDLNAVQSAVVQSAADLTKASKGGGGVYKPLAKGVCWLRLVGYIETGDHEYETTVPGKGKVTKCTPHAFLIFEVSGPKHPPREVGEGENKKTVPNLITLKMKNVSRNEKAGYFKTFKSMNHDGTKTHYVQLLTNAFRGYIDHWTPPNGTDPIAMLEEVNPPSYEDQETGELKTVNPPAVTSPLRVFVWDTQDPALLKQMWDSIFIDGTYTQGEGDDAKEISLNKWQEMVASAKNYEGSPIQTLLATDGKGLDMKERPKLAPADVPDAGKDAESDDPLNGM